MKICEMNWCFFQCQLANDKVDDENSCIFSSTMLLGCFSRQVYQKSIAILPGATKTVTQGTKASHAFIIIIYVKKFLLSPFKNVFPSQVYFQAFKDNYYFLYSLPPDFTILFTSERCNASFRPAFFASKRGSKKSFACPALKIKDQMKMQENFGQTEALSNLSQETK